MNSIFFFQQENKSKNVYFLFCTTVLTSFLMLLFHHVPMGPDAFVLIGKLDPARYVVVSCTES